jgi:hypothetical protein
MIIYSHLFFLCFLGGLKSITIASEFAGLDSESDSEPASNSDPEPGSKPGSEPKSEPESESDPDWELCA